MLTDNSKYHADGRLESLALTAPPAYDLSSSNFELLADELFSYIKQACDEIPNALDDVRQRAEAGLYSPLPVPETWLKEQKT